MLVTTIRKWGDQLPVGVRMGKAGTLVRDFELGPLTGRTHIAMAAESLKDNGPMRTTVLIERTLTKFGPLKGGFKDVALAMAEADREYLSWRIGMAGRKDEPVDIHVECPECGLTFEVPVRHGDMPVSVLEEGDCAFEGGHVTFLFPDSGFGALKCRLLTGRDAERMAPFDNGNPTEASLRRRHASVVSLGGAPLPWDAFLDLPAETLGWISEAQDSLDIGASQIMRVSCAGCAKEVRAPLSPFTFLLGSGRPTVRPPYETRSSP